MVPLSNGATATPHSTTSAATVSGPARVRLTVEFRNMSSEVHNLVFVGALDVRSDPVVPAGGGDTLRLPALEPGDYDFVCTIHEGMTGTLTLD